MDAAYTTDQLPPGVFVDKQTSLLLAPALDDVAGAVATKDSSNANNKDDNNHSSSNDNSNGEQNSNDLPRVQNDEECYVEEDMHSLLSSIYFNDGDDNVTMYDDDSVFTTDTISELETAPINHKKKKRLGKLQWRPPGMAKKRGRSRNRQKKPVPMSSIPTAPSSKSHINRYNNNVSSNDSVYGTQSVHTLKSSHTSFSTNTQKAGNRNNGKSSNPRSLPRNIFRGTKDQHGLPPSSSSAAVQQGKEGGDGDQLDGIVTNASNNNGNSNVKRSRRLRLLMQRQEEDRLRKQDEDVKRQFNSSHHSSSSSSSSKINHKINSALADDASVELVPSPTSVSAFDKLSSKMKRVNLEPIGEDGPNNNNSTTATTNDKEERNSGPIDIDTCSPHLPSQMTETERRNLAAMHKLGYTHLRKSQVDQAITIFTEILRGQKERHGKHSLQAAMAMHNLGVVYVKARQYKETSKLCEKSSKIRREELGKDHLDVAVSLAQMGVALMELSKYEGALVVFREALRIRRLNLGKDCNHTLIVRILNNIGCALFELDKMEEARVTFEETLCMQRELMKEDISEKDVGGGKEKKVNLAKGRSVGSSSEASSSGGTDKKKEDHMLLSIALTLCNLGSIHLRTGQLDASFVVFEEALLIQESVLGENHKVVSNTRDSLNFVIKSIKNRDLQPPPPPSKASAAEAEPESSKAKAKGQDKPESSKGQEEDSTMFGLFDNYLTCNINVAEEIEGWVEETKRFQDSVHCS